MTLKDTQLSMLSDRKIISVFKVTIYVKQLTDLINMKGIRHTCIFFWPILWFAILRFFSIYLAWFDAKLGLDK